MVVQVKEGFYHDHHLIDTFFPLAIKVFGCLHQQADIFFHRCASMVWLVKGTGGCCLVILSVFYR